MLLLAKQSGDHIDKILGENTEPLQEEKARNAYAMRIGMIVGFFMRNADLSEQYKFFTASVLDTDSSAIWRGTAILLLGDIGSGNSKLMEINNYGLIDMLEARLNADNENIDIRCQSGRAESSLLRSLYKKALLKSQPAPALTERLDRNIKSCVKLLKEPTTPAALAQQSVLSLRRYHQLDPQRDNQIEAVLEETFLDEHQSDDLRYALAECLLIRMRETTLATHVQKMLDEASTAEQKKKLSKLLRRHDNLAKLERQKKTFSLTRD